MSQKEWQWERDDVMTPQPSGAGGCDRWPAAQSMRLTAVHMQPPAISRMPENYFEQ